MLCYDANEEGPGNNCVVPSLQWCSRLYYFCFSLNRNAPSVLNSGLPWPASNEVVIKFSTTLAPEIQVPYSLVDEFCFSHYLTTDLQYNVTLSSC